MNKSKRPAYSVNKSKPKPKPRHTVCVACEGSGVSSKGYKCHPCDGKGYLVKSEQQRNKATE